jgi:two-component system CheB/CheR fusion protein
MDKNSPLYVVGIGSSAGGIEALQIVSRHLIGDLPCCFVIAQHLSPIHKSNLVSILTKETKLVVKEAYEGVALEQETIYVTPPNSDIVITHDDKLSIIPASKANKAKPSIDILFASIANHKRAHSVGVILSGTGSDGAKGMQCIKNAQGLTLIQEPKSAKYDTMPLASLDSGVVDQIFALEDISSILFNYISKGGIDLPYDSKDSDAKSQIFALLQKMVHIDFSLYKQTTIERRMFRRMSVLDIASFEEYLRYIESNDHELYNLGDDFLIGVTEFFRDKDAFVALQKNILQYIQSKKVDRLRIWCAGCSTGEEAYSLMILLFELRKKSKIDIDFQMFATDVDAEAILFARKGVYDKELLKGFPQTLIEQYFLLNNDQYEVAKQIKESIIFSKHNIAKDPPFSKIDLISCRNLLIYFNQELQHRVFASFHKSLHEDGLLFLGKSDSVGVKNHSFFVNIDKKNYIYRSLCNNTPSPIEDIVQKRDIAKQTIEQMLHKNTQFSLQQKTQETIANEIFSHYVVLNDNFDIIYLSNDTNPYFSLKQKGEASLHFFKLIDTQLEVGAKVILYDCKKQKTRCTSGFIRLMFDNKVRFVKMIAYPLEYGNGYSYYVLGFLEFDSSEFEIFENFDPNIKPDETISFELNKTKAHLQMVIEELETSNEDLAQTNEELQSVNEELLSNNEELQTTNEELQSANEELQVAYNEITLERKVSQSLELEVKKEVALRMEQEHLIMGQSRSAIMGDMISMIAHQWRQPLNQLNLLINLQKIEYRKDLLSDEKMQEFAQKSEEILYYMSNTIDDFRNFFKQEKEHNFDIIEAINKALSLGSIQLSNAKIELDFIHPKEPIYLSAAKNEFIQVILTLLSNAKDAIISLQQQHPFVGKITIEVTQEDKIVIVSLKDNGIGAPLEVIRKMFEPYFTTKDSLNGTGLGLYMVQMIIGKNMQGNIVARNLDEGGLEMLMTIPKSKRS